MRRRQPLRDLIFLLAAISTAATIGCTAPVTDIVATVSEDVGAWDVANAHVEGTQLTADVCLARIDSADEVSDRVVHQLVSHGYDRIQLAMYAPEGDAARRQDVTWTRTGGKQMQPPSQSAENACAAGHQTQAGH